MTPVRVGRARVLLAITVYDGREFVPDAIRSARRIVTERHDLDVLVLDDHSPEPGWSEQLAALCADLGVRYYCSPRNLGIPRNVNLGLLAAHTEGYSHVIVANSDVLFPANLLDALVAACDSDERIASVTAWSNNASIYSLPNDDPNALLSDQQRVDWVSSTLAEHYGAAVVDVPAGISFCVMMPAWAIGAVGLMDPVFGRGYCEETDWSQRSLSLGHRCTIAPGVFVYHAGRGSNETAGLLPAGATTVDEHEAIVDMRFPRFRSDVGAYMASGVLEQLHAEGSHVIVQAAARELGYSIEVAYLGTLGAGSNHTTPVVLVDPSMHDAPVTAEYIGFRTVVDTSDGAGASNVADAIRAFGGGAPNGVNVLDRGPRTQHLLAALGADPATTPRYPSRV